MYKVLIAVSTLILTSPAPVSLNRILWMGDQR